MKQIIVIGGGAAGLMAAVIAGREGARVILLEKMNMVGKLIWPPFYTALSKVAVNIISSSS
jgi:thioredoxin reductase